MNFNKTKTHKSFDGETVFCEHSSKLTKTDMKFSYFKPEGKIDRVVIWLSGLTCTEENFMAKAGVQKLLSHTSTMVVCPDTSPRGLDLADEHSSYDFGSGASFYVNATTDGYRNHYQMYDYLLKEFIPMIKDSFSVSRFSITGHSMGGHGALIFGLRNPNLFESVSAFSPIVNPISVPWGQKAFSGYLGDATEDWKVYDACELITNGHKHPKTILIEQGLSDDFLEPQLKTKNFEQACAQAGQALQVNYREGYDHSYYFIASFLKVHLDHLMSY